MSLGALPLCAQSLSYDNRRDIAIPDHSTLRIGPFYSTVRLTESAGYRYTKGTGAGSDFLIDNNRGRVRSDGSDFPIVTTVDLRNYIPLTRHSDLDISLRISYRYYPLDTQEDDFNISVPDDGLNANISSQFRLTPYLVGSVFERFAWITQFVDERGLEDNTGGRRFERIQNDVGVDLDWLMAKDKNLNARVSRTDVIPLEDEFDSQERVTYTERLTFEHRIVEGIVAGVGTRFTQTDYDDPSRADSNQSDVFGFVRATGSKGGLGRLPLSDSTTLAVSVGLSAGAEERVSVVEREGGGDTEESARNRDRNSSTLNADASLRTDISKYLSHEIGYSRGLRGGFDTSFEEYDRLNYSISYNRVGVGVRLFTDYDTVEPTDETQGYETWIAGVAANYPLFSFLSLDGSYTYNIRSNRRERIDPDGDLVTEEVTRDYLDNVFRIGTSLAVFKEISLITYYERRERESDDDDLDTVRNTFEIRASYSHTF